MRESEQRQVVGGFRRIPRPGRPEIDIQNLIDFLDLVVIQRVVADLRAPVADVSVCIDEARHQKLAATVDDVHPGRVADRLLYVLGAPDCLDLAVLDVQRAAGDDVVRRSARDYEVIVLEKEASSGIHVVLAISTTLWG